MPDGLGQEETFSATFGRAVAKTLALAVFGDAMQRGRKDFAHVYVRFPEREGDDLTVYVPSPPLARRSDLLQDHAIAVTFAQSIVVDYVDVRYADYGVRNEKAMAALCEVACEIFGGLEPDAAVKGLRDEWTRIAALDDSTAVFQAARAISTQLPPEKCPLARSCYRETEVAFREKAPLHALATALAFGGSHNNVSSDALAIQAAVALFRFVFPQTNFAAKVVNVFPSLARPERPGRQAATAKDPKARGRNGLKRSIARFFAGIFKAPLTTPPLTEEERVRAAMAEQFFRLHKCPICL